MPLKRCSLLLGLVLFVIVGACQEKENVEIKTEPSEQPALVTPAVYGVVQQSPPRSMPPKQPLKPGPVVPGVTVALLEFTSKEEPAGNEIARTVTDSSGAYRLEVAPGTYYLVAREASIPYPQYTTGFMGKSFSPDDSVHVHRIVELTEGAVEINLILPQAWPE